MATPFSTPGYSKVRRPPPSSVASSSHAVLRAPIHNPFDKFTQPEFDAWIGDITGALKRALGREEPPPDTPVSQFEDTNPADVSAYGDVDDSFAEIKARRAAKGKERAREDDASHDDEESGSSEVVVISSDEEDGEEDSSHDESGAEDRGSDAGAGSEENIFDQNDEDQLDQEIGYEVLDEDEARPLPVSGREFAEGGADPQDIDERAEETDIHERLPEFSPPQAHQPLDVEDGDGVEVESEDGDEHENVGDVEELGEQPLDRPVNIPDAWEGPSTYAEDFYSGGDVHTGALLEGSTHLMSGDLDIPPPVEVVEDREEVFPPHDESKQPVDITDPWSAPQAYAEDLYVGGEVVGDTSGLSPSHLTPAVSTPEVDDGMTIIHGVLNPLELIIVDPSNTGHEAGDTEENLPPVPEPVLLPESNDASQEAFDSSLLDDLYADLGQTIATSSTDYALDVDQLSYPASGISSAGKQSPRPKLHDRSSSPPRASLQGHVDWCWPPAFQTIVSAESAVQDPPSISLVPQEEQAEPVSESNVHEILEISDNEPHEVSVLPNTGDLEGTIPGSSSYVNNIVTDEDQVDELRETPPSMRNTHFLEGVSVHDVEDHAIHTREDGQHSSHADDLVTAAQRSDMDVVLSRSEMPTFERGEETLSEDVGFGDLPDSPIDTAESLVNGNDVFNLLANLSNVVSPVFPYSENNALTEQFAESEFLNLPETEDLSKAGTDPLDFKHDAGDSHGTFAMPTSAEGEEYPATEVTTDDEPMQESEPDVMTDHGDLPATELTCIVEEIITEGRRTEEPEILVTDATTGDELPAPQDISRLSREISPDVQSVLRDFTSSDTGLSFVVAEPDSEDESPRRRRPRFLLDRRSRSAASSDKGQSIVASPIGTVLKLPRTAQDSRRTPSPISDNELQVLPVSCTEVQIPANDTAEGEARTHSLIGQHLETDVPAPVSADPAVPDPASIWGTPRATSPQTELSSRARADELTRAAETGGLLRVTLKQPITHSASGLFTPASGTESSPASPSVLVESNDITCGMTNGEPPVNTVDNPVQDLQDALHNEKSLEPPSSVSETPVVLVEDKTVGLDIQDADADGDLDPEYHDEDSSEVLHPQETVPIPDNSDHFTLMGSGGGVTPAAVGDDPSTDGKIEPAETSSSATHVAQQEDAKTEVVLSADPSVPEEGSSAKPEDPFQAPVPESRSLKRRRFSGSPAPSDITPPIPVQAQLRPQTPTSEAAPNKQDGGRSDDEGEVDSIASSRNGELIRPISKGERPTTRTISRASSITSGRSAATESSSVRVAASLLPPPFLHAGGVLHHHHGKAPPQQPLRLTIPTKVNDPSSSQPDSSRTETQQSESSSALHPGLASLGPPSSSPVTRSNCRFHKISVPLDEDGPRVFFVIPGCSLTNTELMEEEEIEDHGDATLADNARLVPNVEALDFSSYLISVLRQLVRVDYLREQEIFYLPQEGENIGLKPKPKSPTKARPPRDSVGGRSSTAGGSSSTRTTRNLPRSPVKSKLGRASSVSTVSSVARGSQSGVGSASIASSFSADEMSEAGDGPPKPKRRKGDKRRAPLTPENLSFKARRSKRLSTDASAYKPDQAESDDSGDEERPKRTKRKTQRGVKRSRTFDGRQDENEEKKPKSKKRKVHATDVTQPNQETSAEV